MAQLNPEQQPTSIGERHDSLPPPPPSDHSPMDVSPQLGPRQPSTRADALPPPPSSSVAPAAAATAAGAVVPPTGPSSAASMLEAAQSIASMASSGASGVATVSHVLQTQAQATAEQLHRQGIPTALPISSSSSFNPAAPAPAAAAAVVASSSAAPSTALGPASTTRRPSGGHDYAAALSAHTLQALDGAREGAAGAGSGAAAAAAAAAASPPPSHAAVGAAPERATASGSTGIVTARAEVGHIAALAAAQEAEAQLRVQALLGARTAAGSSAGGGTNAAAAAAWDGARPSPAQPLEEAASRTDSGRPTIAMRRRASAAEAAAAAASRGSSSTGRGGLSTTTTTTTTSGATTPASQASEAGGSGSAHPSVPPPPLAAHTSSSSSSSSSSYLERLGLSHIRMPSRGLEQAWGRLSGSRAASRRTAKPKPSAAPGEAGAPDPDGVREGGGALEEDSGGADGASSSSPPQQQQQPQRFWDAGDPTLGYNLAGVPSMPLMPTPPLQMLPPPQSPSLQGTRFSFTGRSGRSAWSSTVRPSPLIPLASSSSSSSAAAAAAAAVEASASSHPRPEAHAAPAASPPPPPTPSSQAYSFQVVQTPGGTARAGWWVPPSAVPDESKRNVTYLGEGVRMLNDEVGGEPRRSSPVEVGGEADASREEGAGRARTGEEGDANREAERPLQDDDGEMPYFQPSYRTLSAEEYAALATAAAYATAALTTVSTLDQVKTSGTDTERDKKPVTSATANASVSSDAGSVDVVATMTLDQRGPDRARDAGEQADDAIADPFASRITWKPLDPSQQEAIASQLMDWAGLAGPERQEQARQALEDRQAAILSRATAAAVEGSATAATPSAGNAESSAAPTPASSAVAEVRNAAAFFPPDFASHYSTQLRALAEGYYSKLHVDGLRGASAAPDGTAPPGVSSPLGDRGATPTSPPRGTTRSDEGRPGLASPERRRRDDLEDHTVDGQQREARQATANQKRGRTMPPVEGASTQGREAASADAARSQATDLTGRAMASSRRAASELQQQQQQQPPGEPSHVAQPSASQDPAALLSAASAAAGVDVRSPRVLEQLLQYAHTLYSTGTTQVAVQSKDADADGPPTSSATDTTSVKRDSASGTQGPGPTGDVPTQSTQTKLHPSLLPLLHTLHKLHPRHLPTLLLLSCAYFTSGDLAASLWYNNQILRIDPHYVESMSNIGTTLRALGRWREAESWWWRAIRLRPGYWDAYENLLGVLCSPQQVSQTDQERRRSDASVEAGLLPDHEMAAVSPRAQVTGPRFAEALRLCEFVESHVVNGCRTFGARSSHTPDAAAGVTVGLAGVDGSATGAQARSGPQCVPANLPVAQVPRLQNLFYAKGNLKYVLPRQGVVPASLEYQRAVEVVVSPSTESAYSLRDLVVATCVVGLLSMGTTIPGSAAALAAMELAASIGVDMNDPRVAALVATGAYAQLCPGGVLRLVHRAGDVAVATLLRLGGGQLPMVMLPPESATRVTALLFAETGGCLPGLTGRRDSSAGSPESQQRLLQQASQATSTILLTLAKLFQDGIGSPTPGEHGALRLGGALPPSASLLLPLYYLALSLHPSASTANNLGILLSSIPVATHVLSSTGEWQQLNGQALAMQFYTYGLQLDARHPHLYTNLGSLLKDLGHLPEAIGMYERAVSCNPNFDVALANLGNAIKDQGRTQDSVQYYRRAVRLNPRFPEALCGLVNALLAVCDWREVYADEFNAVGLDEELAAQVARGWTGWMSNVSELLDRQLDEGAQYGAGSLQSSGTIEDWVRALLSASGDTRPELQVRLATQLRPFFATPSQPPLERAAAKINEGSFVIRLVERNMRKSMRRWYLAVFGPWLMHRHRLLTSVSPQGGSVDDLAAHSVALGLPTPTNIVPSATDAQLYARLRLPASLVTPAVPTVLPFHTFTLKIPPRSIRLISHRNALRISQSTLTQMWLPPHIYPPPPPPSPRLRLGYVSSDFNNHPLAHLMQSVFGLHDASRFEVFLYATTPPDGSPYRRKIEDEAHHFINVGGWSNQQVVERIVSDGIHILMNLNGYTKGARNEIFAARPCAVQMEYMGFAGGMASGWTDWIVADPVCCPPGMTAVDKWREARRSGTLLPRATDLCADLDPEAPGNDWVYAERFIYMPHTYFVTDHRQGFREAEASSEREAGASAVTTASSENEAWEEEEKKRWTARKSLFPDLPDHFVIFTCFNQLYKLEPEVFRAWLRILARVPNSILWLLRFPAAGEAQLLRTAREWAGDEVASRLVFTEVAPKSVHIHRGRIADLFLDSFECGAHTTSADILWSGTPVLTWPKHAHKMCSCVAASIVHATGFGEQMTVHGEQAYVERAVSLAQGIEYDYVDARGKSLPSAPPVQSRVTAEALAINTASSAAVPHSSQPSAAGISAQQPGAATVGGQIVPSGGDASKSEPGVQGDGSSIVPSASSGQEANRSPTDTTVAGGDASTQTAAAAAAATTTAKATHVDAELAASQPPRGEVLLQPGPQAPAGAVSRRARGELAVLRRELFLTRDRSKLFDTSTWVRDLERGYLEAWRRFEAGTDCEDNAEWEALPEDAPEKISGHIWVATLPPLG